MTLQRKESNSSSPENLPFTPHFFILHNKYSTRQQRRSSYSSSKKFLLWKQLTIWNQRAARIFHNKLQRSDLSSMSYLHYHQTHLMGHSGKECLTMELPYKTKKHTRFYCLVPDTFFAMTSQSFL